MRVSQCSTGPHKPGPPGATPGPATCHKPGQGPVGGQTGLVRTMGRWSNGTTPGLHPGNRGSTPRRSTLAALDVGSWSNGTTPARQAGNLGSIPGGSTAWLDGETESHLASNETFQVRILVELLVFRKRPGWYLWCRWSARLPVKQEVRVRFPSDTLRPVPHECDGGARQTSNLQDGVRFPGEVLQPVSVADCTRLCESRRPGSTPGRAT